jgi:hypothetical protein
MQGGSMRSFVLPLVTAAGLFLASSAFADPPAAQPQAAPAPAPASTDDLDKVVCRSMPPKTGSRIGPQRECRTQREWDSIREQDQKEITKMQIRDNLAPHM